MKIIKYLVERPTLMWSFMAAILIAGLLCFIRMPKLEDPVVPVKQAVVVVARPGASVHEMELQVAQQVEESLRTLPDVRKIMTDCQQGQATFTVEFEETVLMDEIEQHFDILRRRVNDLQQSLPPGCVASLVLDDQMDIFGIFYSLQGDGYTPAELYDYAKLIRRELLGVKGIKRVSIYGDREETVNIVLDKSKIAANGLLPTQITMALQDVCNPVDAGKVNAGTSKLAVRVDTMVCTIEGIKNIYLPTIDGSRVKLSDVAKVERNYATPQRNGFFVNGKPALAICMAMEDGVVVPDVGKAVDRKLAEVFENIPVGITTEKIFFQPDKVDEAVNSFLLNLVESVLIVILLLIFSMGWRGGVIIGTGLVLTIAASFPLLMQMGTTLQRISLGAFIIAMGMLVDNSIVVMDGILKDRKRRLYESDYLYRTGKLTAMPLLGATIIAASTFISVFLSPDSTGEYACDLFLVLAVSLLVSWVLALVQVPFFTKLFFKEEKDTVTDTNNDLEENKALYNGVFYRMVRNAVTWITSHRIISMSAFVAALIGGVCCLGFVKNLFFPDFDYKQFVVEYTLPPQSNPEKVRDDLIAISDSLQKNELIERVAISTGSAPSRYCLVRPINPGGDFYGELIIDCKDYDDVLKVIPTVREYIRQNYPDAYARIRKYNFSISTSHTVEVGFSGPDPVVLRRLADEAKSIMRKSKNIDTYSIHDNWQPRTSSLAFKYETSDGARSGIQRSDIANAIQAAGDGMACGVMAYNDKRLTINLQIRNADGTRIINPEEIPVWNMTGQVSTIGAVTRGNTIKSEENAIYRLNGMRTIEVECDPDPENDQATPAVVLNDIMDEINSIPLPQGYQMKWLGEQELQNDSMDNTMKYMPLILMIMLGVLLLLFGQWNRVIIIILCIPFLLVGVAPSLYLTSTPLTFMAIIGLMGLMGMMTKNTIVLVDEADRLIQENGYTVQQAAIEATVSRVRPVFLASFTTIVGMVPLIPDPMYSSLAITIMGGLFIGTIVTLLLLPLLLVIFVKNVKSDKI